RATAAVGQHLAERVVAIEAVRSVVLELVVEWLPAAGVEHVAVAEVRARRRRRGRADERAVDGGQPRLAARERLGGSRREIDLPLRELGVADRDERAAREQQRQDRGGGEVAQRMTQPQAHRMYSRTWRSTARSCSPGSARPARTSPSAVRYGVHTMRIAAFFGIGTVWRSCARNARSAGSFATSGPS